MKETVIPKTRTVNLLNVVLSKIKFEPQVFVEVVKILESESSFQKQANELVHSYQSKIPVAVSTACKERLRLSLCMCLYLQAAET